MELALNLNLDGLILDVLKDDKIVFEKGLPFVQIVDIYSRGKFLNFLREIKSAIFLNDWEINLLISDELVGVKLSGVCFEDRVVLIGTSTKSAEAEYIDEFSEMNNQQNAFLREQIKALHKIQSTQKNDWIEENQILKKEVSFLKKELVDRNHTNEQLSNEIKNSKVQLSKLKEGYWDVSDEIRSSLQLLQRDYEICEQQNEDQIFEIKDILDRYDQVFEEEI
jgi:hypothetical protein